MAYDRDPSPTDLARPLSTPADLDPLLDRIGDARYVLLGEASHGTHEFYRWRDAITRRLVEEKGFTMVVVEGDWPHCSAVNTWVRHLDGGDRTASQVLAGFDRWPRWMWGNEEVASLITWLRDRNAGRVAEQQVGFYGFDVYSLWESLRAVMAYLQAHEPDAVEHARQAIRCFEPYREDPQSYAWASRLVPSSCESEVVSLLQHTLSGSGSGGAAGVELGREGPEHRFDAEQNALVARNAERYYRAMVRGGPDSWNVRDTHMVETLERLMAHHGPTARCIVWAHNTHIGDARATDMADHGMANVGQLVRQRHARGVVVAVGFSSHHGTVVAADSWGAPTRVLQVPPARQDSVEHLLHQQVGDDALFVFPQGMDRGWLGDVMPHRAIGVVYDPRRERMGNYVPTVMDGRYDALIHLEATTALHPLEAAAATLTSPVVS